MAVYGLREVRHGADIAAHDPLQRSALRRRDTQKERQAGR
eukprot:COSAG03_NODE_22767_length_287_cov_0.750000_1_plen_39_part_10